MGFTLITTTRGAALKGVRVSRFGKRGGAIEFRVGADLATQTNLTVGSHYNAYIGDGADIGTVAFEATSNGTRKAGRPNKNSNTSMLRLPAKRIDAARPEASFTPTYTVRDGMLIVDISSILPKQQIAA